MLKAIVIFSGGIKKEQTGRWQSTELNEADNKLGAPGGYLRVLAAKYLWDEDREQFIVATGGKGYDVIQKDPRQPLICEIIKEELMELGVNESRVLLERDSNNTLDQIKALSSFIKENDPEKITVVSSAWHLPRVKVMMEKEEGLGKILGQRKIKLRSAEEILLEKDRQQWQEKIERAYESAWLKKRIEREEKGINDFLDGRYKINKIIKNNEN